MPAAIPCPHPLERVLRADASNVGTKAHQADFSAAQKAHAQAVLGETSPNKVFLCTFRLALPGQCCQVTKAVLTVQMRSLPGQLDNDTIAVMHNGATVQPWTASVYGNPAPVSAGQAATRTWTMGPADLARISAERRLSFSVQDDTAVVGATLDFAACCVNVRSDETRPGSVDGRPPTRS